MKVLGEHGKAPYRVQPWALAVGAVVIVALVVVLIIGFGGSTHPTKSATTPGGGGGGGGATTTTNPSEAGLALTASSPAAGASGVASNTEIKVTFSTALASQKVVPTLKPAVAGTWVRSGSDSLVYELDAPLVPSTQEVVTIPGGAHGLKAANGKTLSAPASFQFSVAPGDTLRLQQLLAELDYLPLNFTPTGPPPAPKDMAQDETGTFAWKWATLPTELTSLWTQGIDNEISKAAIESFENQNELTVDGEAGPAVWTTLLRDAAAKTIDTNPYVYVLVNKVQPENLTLWNNGAAQYSDILVNTGAQGADTVDGNYAVFEHVRYSDMKGTNPDGSKYDDPNVPYASYFNGGDALHGFIRASYGYPQSNGCVEMSYANAALVWPLTPIGTIVTVEGPASPPLPPTTTTSSTSSTTTTTAPGATTTAAPPTTTPTTAAPATGGTP
jgi:hypothetical protein